MVMDDGSTSPAPDKGDHEDSPLAISSDAAGPFELNFVETENI